MKKLLKHREMLIYYDGVQLFVGEDQMGVLYICLLVEIMDDGDRFLCVPISPERIAEFYHGDIDLREIFINPETEELFFIDVVDISQESFELIPLSEPAPEEWLPDVGFIYKKSVDESTIVLQSKDKGKAIIWLSVNPPEARIETQISTKHLTDVLIVYQNLVKFSYAKAAKSNKGIVKEILETQNQSNLNVVGVGPGSFTIYFQSEASSDLMGYVDIAKGLQQIDEITRSLENTDEALSVIRKYKGHFANCYLRLLELIVKSDIPLTYSWTIPEFSHPIVQSINHQRAKDVYKELVKMEELGFESIEFVGKFTKADVRKKSWTVEEQDGKSYSGILSKKTNVSLSGVVIDNQIYRFACEEIAKEVVGTGREENKLYLLDFQLI